jgi:hypothetical protein
MIGRDLIIREEHGYKRRSYKVAQGSAIILLFCLWDGTNFVRKILRRQGWL